MFFCPSDGPTRTQKVGTWSKGNGLLVPEPQIYERRKNLTGVTLRNTVIEWNPLVLLAKDSEPTGFMGEIYDLLKQVCLYNSVKITILK